MQRRGLEPNLVIYTAAISACEREGATETTDLLLQQMVSKGILPTARTFNAIMAIRPKVSETEGYVQALDILRRMREEGVEPDVFSYTLAIDACERAKQWEAVVQVVDDARRKATVIMLSRKMSALTKLKRWREALEVFDYNIKGRGLQPDSITYTHALTACTQGGMVEEALGFLREMHSLQVRVSNCGEDIRTDTSGGSGSSSAIGCESAVP